jgi:hypothetical protein
MSGRVSEQDDRATVRSSGCSLADDELQERLYPQAPTALRYPTPDFAAIQRELASKGVTRMLLWQEYKAARPGGCQYSAFCRDYETWLGRQDAVMRFEPSSMCPGMSFSSTVPAWWPRCRSSPAFHDKPAR